MSSRVLRSPDGFVNIADEAAITNCYNVVASLADLPDPVAGVRTLPAATATLVCGEITLPAGERIVVPNDAILVGRDADIDGLLGDVNAPLVSSAGNGLVLEDLFLRNYNAGADAFCIRTTSLPFPASRVTRIGGTAVSVGGNKGILVEDASAVSLVNVLNRCETDGIVFRGTGQGLIIDGITAFPAVPATSRTIFFDNGCNYSSVRVQSCQIPLFDPAQVSIELDAGGTLNLAGFFSNAFIDTIGGPANGLVGLGPDLENAIIFFANYGVAESRFGGGLSINGNPASIQTVIPALNTWVPIGAGNPGTHPPFVLDPSSARVVLDQPAGAESAVLRYVGGDETSTHLTASVSLRAVTLGTARAIAARLVLFPAGGGPAVPIDPAFTTVTAGLIAAGNSLSLTANLTLQPGDGIGIEVQNRTDADNIVVDSVDFGFNGT